MERTGDEQRSRRASRAWLLTAAGGLEASLDAEEHRRLRVRAAGPPGRQPSASPPPPQLSASPRLIAGGECLSAIGEPQPMVRLSCAGCGEVLSERGLCVQLVLDPSTKLFSTDTRPSGVVEQGPVGVVPGQCLCRIQDFACSCGLRVGYHLAKPCSSCGPRQSAHSNCWFFSARCVSAEPLRGPAGQPLTWPARPQGWAVDPADENRPPAGVVPPLPALRAHGLEGKALEGASFWPLTEVNGRRGPERPLDIEGLTVKAQQAEAPLLASRAAAADAEARAAEAAAAGVEADRRAAEAEAARAGALRAAAAAEARAAEAEAARAVAEARLAQEQAAPRAAEVAARDAEAQHAAGLRSEVEELRARVAALQAQLARPTGEEGPCAGGGAAASAAFEEARLLCAQRLSEKREALSRWERELARREGALAARERAVEAPAASWWGWQQPPADACGRDGSGVPPQPCAWPPDPRGAGACAAAVPATRVAHGWLAGARRRLGCGSRRTPAAQAAQAAAWMAAARQGGGF